MTEKELFKQILGMLEEITKEEYPQLYDSLISNMDKEEGEVYMNARELAMEIQNSDEAKLLPPRTAAFVRRAYEEVIEEGDAYAACNLGVLYYTGRIGEQSYAKAMKYYTIAAKGGSQVAQENLGYCYYYGRDTAVDYEKAFHYFALGAFNGRLRSLYKIGDMYRNGYYVEQNFQEAFSIYSRCAKIVNGKGISQWEMQDVGPDIMMRMGDCYYEGLGTETDLTLALEYYQTAERLFFERLLDGDFLIQKCYEKVVARQAQVRKERETLLPKYRWTKEP